MVEVKVMCGTWSIKGTASLTCHSLNLKFKGSGLVVLRRLKSISGRILP